MSPASSSTRDSFNAFDRRTEEDNLIQTYVPIVDAEGQPARGVFEIYTDVNSMVQHTEEAQWQLIGGGALIMALLYLALLAVVRYAERIIARQQDEIREIRRRWSGSRPTCSTIRRREEADRLRPARGCSADPVRSEDERGKFGPAAGSRRQRRRGGSAADGAGGEGGDQRGARGGAQSAPVQPGRTRIDRRPSAGSAASS